MCVQAATVGKGNRVQRFLRASRDEDTLKTIQEGIAKSISEFQVSISL